MTKAKKKLLVKIKCRLGTAGTLRDAVATEMVCLGEPGVAGTCEQEHSQTLIVSRYTSSGVLVAVITSRPPDPVYLIAYNLSLTSSQVHPLWNWVTTQSAGNHSISTKCDRPGSIE